MKHHPGLWTRLRVDYLCRLGRGEPGRLAEGWDTGLDAAQADVVVDNAWKNNSGSRNTWNATHPGRYVCSAGERRRGGQRNARMNAQRRRDARDARVTALREESRALAPIALRTWEDANGVMRCNCPAHLTCDTCPDEKRDAAERTTQENVTRFYAATNVRSCMKMSDDELCTHIHQSMRVSDALKGQLLGEWGGADGGRMAHQLPLRACASCGIRDPNLSYERRAVDDLPACFRVSAKQSARRAALGSVELLVGSDDPGAPRPTSRRTELRPIISCYEDGAGVEYHLHPELVDEDDHGHASAFLCQHCCDQSAHGTAPKMSIAAGIDFGLQSRVPALDSLTDAEEMLLSSVRLYHVIVKV